MNNPKFATRWANLAALPKGSSSELRQSVKSLQEQAARERSIFSDRPTQKKNAKVNTK